MGDDYAAAAAIISCRFARVKADSTPEKIKVKTRSNAMRTPISGFEVLRLLINHRRKTGTIRRSKTAASIINVTTTLTRSGLERMILESLESVFC